MTMKTLNQRRCELLKTEKIAVENTGGSLSELREIFKGISTHPLNTAINGVSSFYKLHTDNTWTSGNLPFDGYQSHPISWFYEQDEAVRPTIDNLLTDARIRYPNGTVIKPMTISFTEVIINDNSEFYLECGNVRFSCVGYNIYIYRASDGKWAEIISSPKSEAPQPEAEIIGWELGIDVPEWGGKAGSIGKVFKIRESGIVWDFGSIALPESILRDMKSAKPIYKRTAAQILDDLMQGRITKDEAVKLIETKK